MLHSCALKICHLFEGCSFWGICHWLEIKSLMVLTGMSLITCNSWAERECTGCKRNKMGTKRSGEKQKMPRKEKKNRIKASLDGVTCPVLFTGVWSGESQKPRVRQLEVGLVDVGERQREEVGGILQRWKFIRINFGVCFFFVVWRWTPTSLLHGCYGNHSLHCGSVHHLPFTIPSSSSLYKLLVTCTHINFLGSRSFYKIITELLTLVALPPKNDWKKEKKYQPKIILDALQNNHSHLPRGMTSWWQWWISEKSKPRGFSWHSGCKLLTNSWIVN